jgi:hypothetical protein
MIRPRKSPGSESNKTNKKANERENKMARHEVLIHENTSMATKESTPSGAQ